MVSKFLYVHFLVALFSTSSFATEALKYECRGKNILAAVHIQFEDSDWDSEAKRAKFTATTKAWINKDPNNEVVFSNKSTSSFFRVEKKKLRTSWWERDYSRRVLVLGGDQVKPIISPNGLENFYTLNLSANLKKADLVWGYADSRGGPGKVCIIGQCGKWRNSAYNAKCKLLAAD